ncbi:MAG TPA: 50S ribosomal protein L25 [Firmicutes bacterium]|nr:50S ribosomal protein L25 [Bacillota bacterium]
MANYQLAAEVRTAFGTNAVKKLRREKLVPGNVYGRNNDNVHLLVAERELEKAIQSGEPLIDLAVGGEKKIVLIKDLQRDFVRGTIDHVDFYEVSMDKPVDTTVFVVLTGEEERESDGGLVNLVMRELNISCLPMDIPENITIDVSQMVIGDTITVSDLDLGGKITVNQDPDEVIVTVAAPTKVEESAEDEEAEVEAAEEAEAEAEAEE